MKKKSFLYGAMLLTISAIISKVLGAIYRIPLTNLIGSEGIGIYQIIFPVYALLLVISSSGIPVCVSRLVSGEVAKGQKQNLKFILKKALFLTTIISFISSILVILLSNSLATLQGNPLATIGYFAISPAILLGSLVAVFRGYFEGLQDMRPTAISEVIEQIAKVALGLLFAVLLYSKGLEYGVMGAVLGISLGEVISLILVITIYYFNNKKLKNKVVTGEVIINSNINNFKKEGFLKHLFLESLPITFGAIIIPLTLFVDSILMINLLTNVGFSTTTATRLFGLQAGVVASLVQLPIIISISISTALLPNIVAAKTVKSFDEISNKSAFSIKLVWFISFACFLGYLLLANNITKFLYSDGLENTLINETQIVINLIYISSISIVYHSLLRIFISLLHAVNKSRIVAKNLLFASIIKILFTIILVSVPAVNIYGASLASTISYAIGCFICLWSVKKLILLNFSKKELLTVPIIAGLFLTLIVLVMQLILKNLLPQNITTILAILMGGISYFAILVFFKAFKPSELKIILPFKKLFNKKE